MEKDFGSWFPNQHSERQSPYLNSLNDPFTVGWQGSLPAGMYPCTNEATTNGTFPSFAYSGQQPFKASQPNEPSNWFYCLPRFRQAFVPPFSSVSKEKLPSVQMENCGRNGSPNTGTGCTPKKFLVFDQSGDQTTLIYSSGQGAAAQRLTSWNPKPPATCNLVKEDFGIKRGVISQFSPFLNDEHNEENQGYDVDSDMHEDTEELNALLYSDDENDYSDDEDEVTSTGHSPSTMTEHGTHQWFGERDEEVASSSGPTKRRKLLAGEYSVPRLVNVSGSEKPFKSTDFEEDAESCCGNFENQVSGDSVSLSGKKRSRKEKIRQTVNLLQSIIPGGKGKDAMVVIDEAIHYLKSLKVKAKSLGLDDAL